MQTIKKKKIFFLLSLRNKEVYFNRIIYSEYREKKKKMTNLTRSKFQAHPFHLVSPSP
jgi:hypothetical protein